MRHIYQSTSGDARGNVVPLMTVSVFLENGITAANVYTASSGGSPVNAVTTANDGSFLFWVDDNDYSLNQRFKITLTRTGYITKSYNNISVFAPVPANTFYPDWNAADQGATVNAWSVKSIINLVGSDNATIILRNCSGSITTPYTVATALTIPVNIELKTEIGGMFVKSGSGTLTINGPVVGNPMHQWLSGFAVGDVTGLKESRPEWFTNNTIPGITDMTSAINICYSIIGSICCLSATTYLITSNPPMPVCDGIIGQGIYASVIKAGNGVTKVLSLGWVCERLENFRIEGNSTANAVGIVYGDTESGAYYTENIRVVNFKGTDSIGIHLKNCLKSLWLRSQFEGSYYDLLTDGGSAGLPTTCTFISCVFATGTSNGFKGITGENIRFINCDFESNGGEGVKLIGGTYPLYEIEFDGCWFEANGTDYSIKVDGTNSTYTIRPIFKNCRTLWSPKSTHFIGKVNAIVEYPVIDNIAGNFQLDNEASCRFIGWPSNTPFSTNVIDNATDPRNGAESIDSGVYKTYTPIISSNVGNQSTTFSSLISLTGKYQKIGHLLKVHIKWQGILNAVTPAYIIVTLPSPCSAILFADIPCAINDVVYETGNIYTDTNFIRFYRAGRSLYGSGDNISGSFVGTIEVNY